jgi:tryptophan synthase alpha chain
MNRYEKSFAALKSAGRPAFIPFASAGDPDLSLSESIFKTYIDAGADVLEIGYPFSDPMADGPVNQRAAQRAIASGLNPKKFFSLIKTLRNYTDIPFGVLLYANTVYHMGYGQFCKRAADAGLDSILVADMPPEEASEAAEAMNECGICSVFIVSELTGADRIKLISSRASGFLYVVSRLGVTGVQQDFSTSVGKTISSIRPQTDLPLCVGFGISKPEHVIQVKQAGADGAIVGSALVRIIEEKHQNPDQMLKALARAVKGYRKATEG